MIDRIDTGTRSSKIVEHNGVAHLTGQVVEGDTIQERVGAGLNWEKARSKQAGSSREAMPCVTIWLADMQDFDGFNEVWNARVSVRWQS